MNQRGQAIAGTVLLHTIMLAALMSWRPAPLPPAPQNIPIVLVELPPPQPEETVAPVLEADPPTDELTEEPQKPETTSEFLPEPTPQPDIAEGVLETTEQTPLEKLAEREVESSVTVEPAPPPGVSLAQADEDENRAEQTEAQNIPPQFVYKFDPFAETAPTTIARVSRAINCARANRETRPAFCPEYDEDDVFLASIAQNRPSQWDRASYDPVSDIAAYRSALNNFSAAQAKPRFNGTSESFTRTHPHDPSLPDAGCRYISFGFTDPFALDKNAAVPDNRSVVCDQEK